MRGGCHGYWQNRQNIWWCLNAIRRTFCIDSWLWIKRVHHYTSPSQSSSESSKQSQVKAVQRKQGLFCRLWRWWRLRFWESQEMRIPYQPLAEWQNNTREVLCNAIKLSEKKRGKKKKATRNYKSTRKCSFTKTTHRPKNRPLQWRNCMNLAFNCFLNPHIPLIFPHLISSCSQTRKSHLAGEKFRSMKMPSPPSIYISLHMLTSNFVTGLKNCKLSGQNYDYVEK